MPLRTKLVVRDPPDAICISTDASHNIVIKHPGYQDNNDRLLSLPAYDDPDGGFDLDTAKTICGILVGNRWDGFFTESRNGPPVEMLQASARYYFILPDGPNSRNFSYPVVPAFSEWQFPHDNLPPSWPKAVPYLPPTMKSDITQALGQRDAFQCQISACEEGYEKAHIVPWKYSAWFHANDLDQYIFNNQWSGERAIDDVHNMILLRADLHKAFDDNKFAFVPKRETPFETRSRAPYVVHMLSPSKELIKLYHNVHLQASDKLVPQFLLARLALSIFPMFEGFLLKPKVSRKILTQEGEIHEATPGECQGYASQTGARSRQTSPSKAGSAAASPKRRRLDNVQEGKECYTYSEHQNKRARMSIPDGKEPIPDPPCGVNTPQTGTSFTSSSEDQHDHSEQLRESIDTLPTLSNPPAPVQLDTILQNMPYDGAKPSPPSGNSICTPDDNQLDLEEGKHYDALRTAALAAERERSDPNGSYKKELDWAYGEMGRKECNEASMRKLYEICGYDIVGMD